MITIVAKQTVKADKIADFLSTAKQLVEETKRSDAGCISYDLYQDSENPGVFAFIEEWEDSAVLDKHIASKHFTELFPQLGQFLDVQTEIVRYQKVN